MVEWFRIHSPKTEKPERNKQTSCTPALADHERAHPGTSSVMPCKYQSGKKNCQELCKCLVRLHYPELKIPVMY